MAFKPSISLVRESQPIYCASPSSGGVDPVGGSAVLSNADALECYGTWPSPATIISDGPYGVGGFPGDPTTPDQLPAVYAPHVAEWSRCAGPATSLWFWGTEVGWATVHPILALHDWEYRGLHIWDKTVAHVAGNVNSRTIRRFPVVTEVCAYYARIVRLPTEDGQSLPLREWLRHEWRRSGLPLSASNRACGVRNAATRKYFTQDHLWYFPPPDMMTLLEAYANQHGRKTSRPYFSLDGATRLSAAQWGQLRSKWNHTHGVTNVWTEPAVRGAERLKDASSTILHSNQKPLRLMERILAASTDAGDVVWEPFGGLCSASVAGLTMGRNCYAAEIVGPVYDLAVGRLSAIVELRELHEGLR